LRFGAERKNPKLTSHSFYYSKELEEVGDLSSDCSVRFASNPLMYLSPRIPTFNYSK
jgi:hypothetical protein